ncbi:peptidyl-prolyl cis-trans isomerase SurA [Algoriphagus boseongensis]|uniref:Peptidyl-prolyl cis-trans isomerase SurA n=1 Tax=Algoriphagus boseongensis TaxID=1442587 RepID=A0A4R6T2W0_9BACT|nr:peptidylprolyl isomerase [Algoriphagus boseongensis]TDQ13735.1 peptidyl-prolyl cis-trans isomerase SurA [Algoriphagus boseongensis]
MNHRTVSAFVFSLILLIQGQFAQEAFSQESESSVLMTVGGKPVYKDDLVYLISKGTGDKSSPGISREEFEENLELFINYQLKVREAEALGLDQSEEFKTEFASFKESLIAPFLIKNSIEEGELRKAYSRMQEIIRASHVLFQFPPNASTEDSLIVLKMALKVKGEIENGGNINELALQYSDDPSAQSNKGDLGYFTSLQMVQPFEDAAYGLQTGMVSDPVLTNFGYHIIQVKDRQPNPGQVRVSHILVRFEAGDATQEENARRKIADIYTEIQKESTVWEDIVRNFSEDPGTKDQGGLLPWFGVGNMIPEFEMAAFSLTEIGEVSPPLRTQYGYHILRLEDKRPIDSFEELEESIRSRILRDSRSGMIQSQVVAIQKARYGFKEDEQSVQQLSQQLNEVTKSELSTRASSTNSPLFTIQGKAYTTSDLANYVQDQEVVLRSKVPTFDFWYDRFVAETLSKEEEKDLESTNKEYQMLLKEYRDGILLFSLMNKEVWEKGIADSLGQVDYFRKNIADYQWGERTEAFIVKVIDSQQLESAKNMLQNQGYNESIINSFESQAAANNPLAFQTESGVFEINEHPVLSLMDRNKTFQEIVFENQTYLVLTGQKFPAGPRKFEESRGLVIRDYQQYLDETLISKLKSKYPVQVNPTIKEETYLALNQ